MTRLTPVADKWLRVLPRLRNAVTPADSFRPRRELLHRIRVAGRDYEFLFLDERYVDSDGRRVYWVQTPTAVERIDVHPGYKILYLGAKEYWPQRLALHQSSENHPPSALPPIDCYASAMSSVVTSKRAKTG